MQNKKGAIELSMTTIIVIVLGVTLLVLGLAFVKNIFSKLGGISDKTFNEAEDLLKGLDDVDSLLTITPSDIEIKQGNDKPVKIIMFNTGQESITVKAIVISNSGDDKLRCAFFDRDVKEGKTESASYTLSSGKQQKLVLIAKDDNGGLRRTGCNVKVTGSNIPEGEQNSGTLLVRVVKE